MESRTQGSRPRTQKNFEAKAKDRPCRGQCQGPRTQTQVFSKKKVLKIFFQAISKKGLQKFFQAKNVFKNFFQAISTCENQKKVFADFPQGFWRFPTKFQRFKNSAVLEPRTGDFRGLEAWGQGLQNVSLSTPPLVFIIQSLKTITTQSIIRSNNRTWKYANNLFLLWLSLSAFIGHYFDKKNLSSHKCRKMFIP